MRLIVLSSLVLLLGIFPFTGEANILHDIKEIIKDIFSGDDDGDKEVERVRKTMSEWKSCLGVQLDKTELKNIQDACDEEFDIEHEKDTKRRQRVQLSACYRVCQLEQLGWLHDTDSEHTSGPYFNHTAMEAFIDVTFPPAVKKSLRSKISQCARSMDSFSDEKACKNYKGFFKCVDKAIHDKCKRKPRSGQMTGTTEGPVEEGTTASNAEEDESESSTPGAEDTEDEE